MKIKQKLPEINFVTALHQFVVEWDTKADASAKFQKSIVKISDNGKINATGERDNSAAYLLTASHPGFKKLLEPAVKKTVLNLIKRFNVITYSSCEGHLHDTFFETGHVRMVSRNKREQRQLLKSLTDICDNTNRKNSSSTVRVVCKESVINTNDGLDRVGVDIFFTSSDGEARSYFQYRDDVMDLFAKEVAKF